MIRKSELQPMQPEPTSRIDAQREVCPQGLSIPPKGLFLLLSHRTERLGTALVSPPARTPLPTEGRFLPGIHRFPMIQYP